MSDEFLRECPGCSTLFTVNDILRCRDIEPIGMQFDPEDPELNLFYFNHIVSGCYSTFVVPVERFEDYLDEEIPDDVLKQTGRCEQRCVDLSDREPCSQKCRYAPYRHFMLRLIRVFEQRMASACRP